MTLNWGNAICRRNIANSTEACEKRQKRAMLIPPITFIEIDESVTFLPNPLIIKIVYENFLQTTSAVYAIILENVSGSVLAHVLRIMPPPLKNG